MASSAARARSPVPAGDDSNGRGTRRDAVLDAALIARCLNGEGKAFQPLVQRYQRYAMSVALRMLGNRADAEDVSQQAFVDAFRALGRFNGEGRCDAFSSWLLRIVINRAKDVLKSKRWTEQPLPDRDISTEEAAFVHESSPTPETSALRGQELSRLEAALQRVPAQYLQVLVLKDIEQLSYEDIRSLLGLPVTTLKIRVIRARNILRVALSNDVE